MTFLKQHMEGSYNWSPEAQRSIYDGNASRRSFDRSNGDQVLFIINVFLQSSGNVSIERGKIAEKLIIDRLPLDTRSEISVLNWLKAEISEEYA